MNKIKIMDIVFAIIIGVSTCIYQYNSISTRDRIDTLEIQNKWLHDKLFEIEDK